MNAKHKDGKSVMVEVVKAALNVSVNEKPFGDHSKKAAIVVEALIAESGGNEHIMYVRDWEVVVQHPLVERFQGSLFSCSVTGELVQFHTLDDGEYTVQETPLGWEARAR